MPFKGTSDVGDEAGVEALAKEIVNSEVKFSRTPLWNGISIGAKDFLSKGLQKMP